MTTKASMEKAKVDHKEKILDKTELEVEVEEREFKCIVHKGPIIGANYLCPSCKAFYCVRCAQALKERNEGCWSCNSEIKL